MAQRHRGAEPTARRKPITSAKSSPHLAELTLDQLRAYRQRLTAEEERASYWRRVVHARMDLLEAESHVEGTLSMTDLVRVLGDTGTGQVRNQLLTVRPADPLPELPALAEMWDNEVDPHDPAEVEAALQRLRAAEGKLTDYRRALHERIDEATAELIVRYRENPAAALAMLPEE